MIKKSAKPHERILYVILKGVVLSYPFRIIFKHFSLCKIRNPKKDKTLPVIEMEGVPIWGQIFTIGPGHKIINGQSQHQIKKNDREYQKTTYSYIHWSNRVWKKSPFLKGDWKRIQQTFWLHFDCKKIKPVMLKSGSKTMIMFGW